MDDLYQEIILEHYHHPNNFGKPNDFDFNIKETNVSCGDSFTFYLKLDKDKAIIKDISFTGTGCAISTAACSLLTEHLKGKPLSEISKLNLGSMQILLGISITPTRLKCLMLPAKGLSRLSADLDTFPSK